jgi:N-acetylmuramoyl-L-alanine amidase
MIFSFKLKPILFSIIFCVLVFSFLYMAIRVVTPTAIFNVPNAKYTVVIDAGHGGIDGGSVGKISGVTESSLNLDYALNLASQFNKMGINCVLTRKNENGLYDSSVKNLKKSDMKKRKEIIDKSGADLVISIHMDSFSLSSTNGAQAFYKKGSESGKIFVEIIQKQLSCNFENAEKSQRVGGYYIVNCTDIPAVLVECGFLSNQEEEALLQDKEYQNKMCYSILCGALDFLNFGY